MKLKPFSLAIALSALISVVPLSAQVEDGAAAPGDATTIDAITTAVSGVLDALHHNASIAAEEPYFALFAPDAVFLGTDGTERWTVDEFRGYVHPYFERGRGSPEHS